jgi:hypothetical protein
VDRNRRSGARTKRRHLHARRARAESFQRPYRYYRVTLGGRVTPSPAPRRLTACVIAGCVGHASGSIAIAAPVLGRWGSGERARCVFHSSSIVPWTVHAYTRGSGFDPRGEREVQVVDQLTARWLDRARSGQAKRGGMRSSFMGVDPYRCPGMDHGKTAQKRRTRRGFPASWPPFFEPLCPRPARKMMDPRSASKSVSTDLEISSMEFHSGLDGPRGEMVRELTRADP